MSVTNRTGFLESSADNSRLATAAICALVFVALVDSGFVAAVAPQIAASLNTNKTLVAGSVAVYAVAAASVALVLGFYGSRVRKTFWLPIAAIFFAGAGLLAAAASHLAVFYTARALAGFAGGTISALAIAALADASPYSRRGRQMSIIAVVYFLAPVVGIPAGALITQNFNWQLSFIAVAALSVIAGVLVWRFPLAQSNALAVDVNSVEDSESDLQRSHKVGFGIIKTFFDSRSKAMGIVGAFFVSGGVVGFTSFIGVWLAEAFHRKPNEIALMYAAAGASAVLGGALGGFLADRYGKTSVALRGSLGFAVLMLFVPTFAWGILLVSVTSAAAFVAGLRIAPLQALITELVPPNNRAAYIAFRNASSQLGIAAAVALSAVLYARFGLFGVGVVCSLLTFFAWFCTNLIIEPQTAESSTAEDLSLENKVLNVRRKFWVHRTLKFALVFVVAVAFGVPYLLSFVVTKAVTRSDERNRPETPLTYSAEFENAAFVSSDGNNLSGWYLPREEKNITIVMTHGLFRSRYELLERGIEFWRRGYAVLLYDVRRHGSSTGEFSTIGYNERLDVIAALEFARSRAPTHRIVLLGVSMGAAATLMAASEVGDHADAVIAESSFLSFRHTITHHVELAGIPNIPFAPMLIHLTAWRMNFNPDDFDVGKAVSRINIPILFIGGGRDVRMPNETVLEPLFAAAHNPLKQKFVIPEAKHGQAYAVSPAEYIAAVETFLTSAMATNSK